MIDVHAMPGFSLGCYFSYRQRHATPPILAALDAVCHAIDNENLVPRSGRKSCVRCLSSAARAKFLMSDFALVSRLRPRYASGRTEVQPNDRERGTTMGLVSGDKGRHHRKRRKKLARRVEMRALRAQLSAQSAGESKAASSAQPARRKHQAPSA